jgi:hypothetical protein
MEATRSSETSVYDKPTHRHIPEQGILQIREWLMYAETGAEKRISFGITRTPVR